MNDVIKTIETLIATYERMFILETECNNIEAAVDTIKTLNFWREQHILALQYQGFLEQWRRLSEIEQQTLNVGSFQRGPLQ